MIWGLNNIWRLQLHNSRMEIALLDRTIYIQKENAKKKKPPIDRNLRLVDSQSQALSVPTTVNRV